MGSEEGVVWSVVDAITGDGDRSGEEGASRGRKWVVKI